MTKYLINGYVSFLFYGYHNYTISYNQTVIKAEKVKISLKHIFSVLYAPFNNHIYEFFDFLSCVG
jgi:hypothetical protein